MTNREFLNESKRTEEERIRDRQRINVGNYKSALKDHKPKDSFWDKIYNILWQTGRKR